MKHPKSIRKERLCDQYGKFAFTEEFEEPDGSRTKWLLFGAHTAPVLVLPLTDDGQVVVVRQYRRGAAQELLELPGGNKTHGQTLEQAARKELLEETGYEAAEWRQLGNGVFFDPCSWRLTFIPFVATDCKKVDVELLRRDKEEVGMEVQLIDRREWWEMCVAGYINDSKSLALTLLVYGAGVL